MPLQAFILSLARRLRLQSLDPFHHAFEVPALSEPKPQARKAHKAREAREAREAPAHAASIDEGLGHLRQLVPSGLCQVGPFRTRDVFPTRTGCEAARLRVALVALASAEPLSL